MASQFAVDLLFRSKGQGELQKFSQGASKVDTAFKKAQGSTDKLGKALGGVGAKAGQAANGISATGRAARASTKAVAGLGTALKAALLPLAGFATVAKYFQGFSEADTAAAKVKSLGVNAEKLKRELLQVSTESGNLASQTELLAGAYDVASAGFSNASDNAKILKASLLGAKGGFSDLNTVGNATTSVLNAYGLSADKAGRLVDGFIQTQNDGKIVLDQYAQQIGRLAPLGAAAGVGIEELNAAISTITVQGVPVEATFTGLRQGLVSVLKPSKEASDLADALGLEFNLAGLEAKGFAGFMDDVYKATQGNPELLQKLFGSVEAVQSILPLTNDGLETFNKNLDNQKTKSGQAADAAELMGGTVSGQITRMVNGIGNLVRALDTVLGPSLKGILGTVNTLIGRMTTLLGLMGDVNVGKATGQLAIGAAQLSTGFESDAVDSLSGALASLDPATVQTKEGLEKMTNVIERVNKQLQRIGPNSANVDRVMDAQRQITSLRNQIGGRAGQLERAAESAKGKPVEVADPAAAARIKALEDLLKKVQGGDEGKGTGTSKQPATLGAQIATELKGALGLSNAQAAGIVGNLIRESGLNPRVNEGGAVGLPRGVGGYGLAQWTGSRQDDLRRFAGSDTAAGDLQTQLRFLVKELTGSESRALQSLRGAQTPEQASFVFDRDFERSGIKALPERAANSRAVFEELQGGNPVGGLGGDLEAIASQADELAEKLARGREDLAGIVESSAEGAQRFQDLFDDSQLRNRLELEGLSSEQVGIQLERSQRLREIDRQRTEDLVDIQKLVADKAISEEASKTAQEAITANYEKQAGLINTLAKGETERAEASKGGKIQQKIKQYGDELADTEGMIVSLAGTIESELGSAMSSAISGLIQGTQTAQEAFSNMFANIGKAFIDMATQMIAKALIMKVLGILRPGASAGAGGGGLGSFGGGSPLGDLSGSMGWTSWAGGGYTGDGARSGGVDGQGGFAAILHPQETVVDHFDAARAAMGSATTPSGAFAENAESLGITNNYLQSSSESKAQEAALASMVAGDQTIKFESMNVGGMDVVTREEAIAIGEQSAKQATARVFSELKNRPARRAMVGM